MDSESILTTYHPSFTSPFSSFLLHLSPDPSESVWVFPWIKYPLGCLHNPFFPFFHFQSFISFKWFLLSPSGWAWLIRTIWNRYLISPDIHLRTGMQLRGDIRTWSLGGSEVFYPEVVVRWETHLFCSWPSCDDWSSGSHPGTMRTPPVRTSQMKQRKNLVFHRTFWANKLTCLGTAQFSDFLLYDRLSIFIM